MKKVIIACVASLALLTSSCGISREAATNHNMAQTEVVLAKPNYKVIGTVEGRTTGSESEDFQKNPLENQQ